LRLLIGSYNMQKKSVLVIGGGAAGHRIAYRLRDAANITLVGPKTHGEVSMAVPRLLVEPDGLAARIHIYLAQSDPDSRSRDALPENSREFKHPDSRRPVAATTNTSRANAPHDAIALASHSSVA
jgi:siroheme synthase (precorrin-2 oxidase/ferrochelatase)